jgi:Zn-dependent protease with chaperone function
MDVKFMVLLASSTRPRYFNNLSSAAGANSIFSSHPAPVDRADALSVIVLPNADGADIIGIDIA